MKIIIIGCGKVGFTLAEQLNNEGHEITLIESDSDILTATTNSIDVMGVVGNGAIHKVQMEAGISDADLMIATTNYDEINMLSCLIAKKAGNCNTIARIRNPEYATEIAFLREELNLSLVINPELTAAREIARLLKFPSAIKIDTFAKGRAEIMKFIVPEDSILHDMQVLEVNSKLRCSVLICAIERDDKIVIPNGYSKIQSGDRVSFLSPSADVMHFFRKVGIENNSVKTAMLIGGGKITYYLAKMLHDTPIKIKIIEQDEERCKQLSADLPEVMVIHGDASNQQLLLEEGIRTTEAFASLTGFDEENIMLSLYAASQSKAKLITKVTKIAFENVINSMNIGSVIYPKLITADRILQYVRALQNSLGSNVETLYKFAGNKAEALEFRIGKDAPLIGIPLEKLSLRDNLLVSCINRGGKIIIPCGKDTIEANDTVVIVTTDIGLSDLKDILK